MPKAPIAKSLFIDGPSGRLEAILEQPADAVANGAVVVCHPHPQHGGTLHNKVAHTLARAFLHAGFAALRFNFRDTGDSDGHYDAGVGEVDDVIAAAGWLRDQSIAGPFWLAGFSFGAAMAIKAEARLELDGLVSVAPAIRRFASGLEQQPRCPWLIVQGDQDELVDIDDTVEWVDSLEAGPELLVVEGSEHFFHGRLVELREAVRQFVVRTGA